MYARRLSSALDDSAEYSRLVKKEGGSLYLTGEDEGTELPELPAHSNTSSPTTSHSSSSDSSTASTSEGFVFEALTKKQRARVLRAPPLGGKEALCLAVAKLYSPTGQGESAWAFANKTGILCLIRDSKKNLVFLLLDFLSFKVLWEQLLDKSLKYKPEKPFFHTFSAGEVTAAFSFADEEEAEQFAKAVKNRNNVIEDSSSGEQESSAGEGVGEAST